MLDKEYVMECTDMQMQTTNANNLYRWAMSQKVPANNFKWKKNPNSMRSL